MKEKLQLDSIDETCKKLDQVIRRREERIKNAPPVEYTFAEEFREQGGIGTYVFPLRPIVIENYGRIVIGLEPVFKEGVLYLQIRQRPNSMYANKVYVLPMQCQRLATFTHKMSFFEGVQFVEWCPEHKATVFLSYPPDDAGTLHIDTFGSVMATVWYE